MNPDLLWFVRLGIDQGLFNRLEAVRIRTRLGGSPAMIDFAQKLIDEDVVENVEALEKLATAAALRARGGPPANDPFVAPSEHDEPAPPRSIPLKPAAAQAQPSPAAQAQPSAGATTPPMRLAPRPPEPAQAAPPKPAAGKPESAPLPQMPPFADLDEKTAAIALRSLLSSAVRFGASDLHLCTGRRPFVRKDRVITFIGDKPLSAQDAGNLNTSLLSPAQRKVFEEHHDLDYALAVSASERYRVNLMVHKDGPSGCYRIVPKDVRSLSDLGFAAHLETLKRLLSYHNGLVLITGPVGSGKTTTLASMVGYLNETRKDHIITVEDPIEVVQKAKGCQVTQRQVGDHTKTFFSALKGALREDPDVIVIGELRDLETIEMAVSAAETGHLVIGTMHTSDAATTLNRLLDVFPAAQQTQIRGSVAESLRGIVCQRLLPPRNSADGLTMACEILVNNVAISNLVREGKTTGLRNTMETGSRDGMCLMDNVIFQLYQDEKITKETALANISNRALRAKIQ